MHNKADAAQAAKRELDAAIGRVNLRLIETVAVSLLGVTVTSVIAMVAIAQRSVWLDRAVIVDSIAIPLLGMTILMGVIHAHHSKEAPPRFLSWLLGLANGFAYVGFAFMIWHLSPRAGIIICGLGGIGFVVVTLFLISYMRPLFENLSGK